nr:MAG TPA: hypothetical protein [Caudoviricetes sp.]
MNCENKLFEDSTCVIPSMYARLALATQKLRRERE